MSLAVHGALAGLLASLGSVAAQEPAPEPVQDARPLAVGLVGAVLLVVALSLVPACVALARRLFPGRHVFFARWGFSHLLLVVASFFAAALLMGSAWPVEPETDALGILARGVLVFGAAGAACVVVARRTEPQGARALGLVGGGSGRAAVAGLACYLLLLPGILGLALLWPHVLDAAGQDYLPQEVLVQLLELEGASLAAALVLAIGVVPFLEELIFRGFLQPLLVQNLREKGGVLVTSLIFASLHDPSAFGPVLGLSLLLGALMLRTRRLAAVWAVHAAHNGIVLAFALLVPGAEDLLRELTPPT